MFSKPIFENLKYLQNIVSCYFGYNNTQFHLNWVLLFKRDRITFASSTLETNKINLNKYFNSLIQMSALCSINLFITTKLLTRKTHVLISQGISHLFFFGSFYGFLLFKPLIALTFFPAYNVV